MKVVLEEDENLSLDEKNKLVDILNSAIDPFEKRVRVMRALDKEKDFSSKISLIVRDRLPKMEMIKKIMLVFRDSYITGHVLKKEFGEVLTPIGTVSDMIKEIDENFWKSAYNEDGSIKRVLDCCNGSGIFLWMVIYKFMIGLDKFIENEDDRYKFIIEKMIYACEIQRSKMFHWLCIVDIYDTYDVNIYRGSFLDDGFNEMKDAWEIDKFSLILSNPPYQQEVKGGSQKPLYDKFILKSIEISDKILFITPSRWFSGGKGLDNFRKKMMSRRDIKIINHFEDASKIFGNGIFITGGINYFLIDKNYSGDVTLNGITLNLNKFDIIVKNPTSYKLIDKMSKYECIDKICKGQSYSGITTNDKRLFNTKINDNYIKCYVSKRNGYVKWIDIKYIRSIDILKWKVILTEATNAIDSGHGSYLSFGNKFIGKPNEICNQSYIIFEVNTELEAKSLLSYLNCKLVNYLVSLRKISQHTKPDTCKWVPMVPFDREWTDEKLFEYFELTEIEKELVK